MLIFIYSEKVAGRTYKRREKYIRDITGKKRPFSCSSLSPVATCDMKHFHYLILSLLNYFLSLEGEKQCGIYVKWPSVRLSEQDF